MNGGHDFLFCGTQDGLGMDLQWTRLTNGESSLLPKGGSGLGPLPNPALRTLWDQERIAMLTGLHQANVRILLSMVNGLTIEERNLLFDSLYVCDPEK